MALLNEMKHLYVHQIFKEWKVLKAFDCSSIGAFETSTVKALHSVSDEDPLRITYSGFGQGVRSTWVYMGFGQGVCSTCGIPVTVAYIHICIRSTVTGCSGRPRRSFPFTRYTGMRT